MKRDKYHMVANMSESKVEKVLGVTSVQMSDVTLTPSHDRSGTKSSDPLFDRLLKAFVNKNADDTKDIIGAGLNVNYQEPMLYNRSPLMYAAKYDFVEGGCLLLAAGADAQLADTQGVTPLHLAASNGNVELVRELLKATPMPDPRDWHGRTPLHYAARSLTEDSKDGCLVAKALLAAHALPALRDIDDTVPLHSAAFNGNASLVLTLLNNSPSVSSRDKKGRTALHLAVKGGRSMACIKLLLHFDSPIDAKDGTGKTALHLVSGRPINYADDDFDASCLQLLLRHGASVVAKDDQGHNALSLALQKTMWWGRKTPRDAILKTVQLLVAKGSPITDCFAMWRCLDTFPSLVMVALNQSIRVNTSAKDSPHLKVKLDMRSLMNDKTLSAERKFQSEATCANAATEMSIPAPLQSNAEMSMLNYIVWSGHKTILRHPLCSAFLHLKWLKVRKIFVVHIVFYVLFVLTLTAFLIELNACPVARVRKHSSEENSSETTFQDYYDTYKQHNLMGLIKRQSLTWVALAIFCIVILLREFVQLMHSPVLYLKNYENYLDVILLVCMVPILLWPEECLIPWMRNLTCVVAIIAWSRLMMFMGHFPTFGVYIVMFSTVCMSIVKFLVIYLPLIIAFALGFLMLLKGIPPFQDFQTALVTSVVMMTGEVEYGDKFLSNPHLYSKLFPCLVLLLFLLLVYIILSNLLVGLAVSDMNSIQKRSELLRLTRQVELMIQVENLLNNFFFPKWLQKYLRNKFSISEGKKDVLFELLPNKRPGLREKLFNSLADIFCNRLLLAKLFEHFISDFIVPDREPSLPNELVEEATCTALTELEIQKRDHLQMATTQRAKSSHKLHTGIQSQHRPFSVRNWTHDSILMSAHKPSASMRASIWRSSFRQQLDAHVQQNQDDDHTSQSLHTQIADLKNSLKTLQETVDKLSWRVSSSSQ